MTSKHLTYHEHTDSILLGPVLGYGQYEGRTLTVQGSGNIVRFTLDGCDGYVDLPLGNFAGLAGEWLLAQAIKPPLFEVVAEGVIEV